MTKQMYQTIESHMLNLMTDSAHDPMHIYRVLYGALEIAQAETNVNMDVLIACCLLHDIGREAQAKDPSLDHAEVGAQMAYEFLVLIGWEESLARQVEDAIRTHRYRKGSAPARIEGKILFDADKLDVTGAIGMARSLIYGGQVTEPLYVLDKDGQIITEGGGAEISSFVQEYHYKLIQLYDRFYTEKGQQLAANRRAAAESFYENLHDELQHGIEFGGQQLKSLLY